MNRTINLLAFAVLTFLWLAFIAAMIFNEGLLLTAWQTLCSWLLVIQIVVWLLALPVTLGLWIWQMSWPLALRLVLVIGLAWVTVFVFFPWKKTGQVEPVQESSSAKT